MTFDSLRIGAFLLGALTAFHAAANDDLSPAGVADQFVNALQHHRFKEAATLFVPEIGHNTAAVELNLKRIDDNVGGFSTLHPAGKTPNGQSVKLALRALGDAPSQGQKFRQMRYAAVARNGQPVFYELRLTTDKKAPQVLAFVLDFPTPDAQAAKRAGQMIDTFKK